MVKDILAKKQSFVLDFGCGVDKVHQQNYQIPDDRYFPLDSDPDRDFDFNSLEDIPAKQKFDFVIMNQVIEHIFFEDCMKMMIRLSEFVNGEGGTYLLPFPTYNTLSGTGVIWTM